MLAICVDLLPLITKSAPRYLSGFRPRSSCESGIPLDPARNT
jgi:hypothetical protein